MTRELLDRQEQRWALVRSASQDCKRLAIFVHGFRGNYLTTWGNLPSILISTADENQVLQNWDFLFLGYSTWHITSYLDIASLIDTNWRKAFAGELPFAPKAYENLALFGHSLGTLGIRQYLCNTPNTSSFLHSVTLLGTPLFGSPLSPLGGLGAIVDAVKQKDARLIAAPIMHGYTIADALRNGGPQLRMLKSWTERIHGLEPWPNVRIVLGTNDLVVMNTPADFINYAGDDKHRFINHSHLDMMQINDVRQAIFDEIVESLK